MAARKSIAPQEHGELPNEKRCGRDFTLLGQYENELGEVYVWCPTCKDIKYKLGDSNDTSGTS